MSILKTTTDLKKYFTFDASFDLETVLPYVDLAATEVKRVLGADQYEELEIYYNTEDPETIEELEALLPYVQRPVVYWAILKGLPAFNVVIGNTGIGVIRNDHLAPASDTRVNSLQEGLTNAAYEALENLLEFLEKNVDDYPLWEESDMFAWQYAFLISSARKFDEYVRIDRSRLTYLNWRQSMADAESLQLAAEVSAEFIQELKDQVKTDTVSEANALVLPLLQRSLAYLTASMNGKPELQNSGIQYLMKAKKLMDTYPDNYPTYTATDVYNSELTNYQTYENDEESLLGVFG